MSDDKVIHFRPDGPKGGGIEMAKVPAEAVLAGSPEAGSHHFFESADGKLEAGVWTGTPGTLNVKEYPVDEFMHFLEGRLVMTYENGESETLKAGDSFLLRKGTSFTWEIQEQVRKYFVTYGSE